MATIVAEAAYKPEPRQAAFHASKAKFKFYGGAMGGGKSKALCEEAFEAALTYPGIEILIARHEHKALTTSTRRTMFREVIPPTVRKNCRVIQSGGRDFIEFPNGSIIHFGGLATPEDYHSTEFGLAVFDEAHQIDEEAVMSIWTRMRQKCADCLEHKRQKCSHLPGQMLFAANPESPGHWLYRYFLLDADETEFGKYKAELRLDEDSPPVGAAEFVFARATDNPYLPESYVQQNLGGLKGVWRDRYLKGEWNFLSGNCYFDTEALTEYELRIRPPLYRFDFKALGIGDRAKIKESDIGKVRVYQEPVEGRSYAIGADVATGRGLDFSTAYVIDLSTMELVAEFHGKVEPTDFAEQLHFLGRRYNTAVIAVEQAGGFGEPVIIALRDGKEGRPAYPKQYRHQLDAAVGMDYVQRYGYPINPKTRPQVLEQLDRAIRERSLPFLTSILLSECQTFCEFEEGTPSPRAQPRCNDDAVMAAAITLEMYRRYGRHEKREKRIAKRKRHARVRKPWYPWQTTTS